MSCSVTYTATKGLSLLGDEVGAWMADTTAETLVGSERVTNGTFDTVTTGWAAGNSATLSIASAKLRVAYNGSDNPYAYQAVATVVGETYQIVADGTYSTAAFNIGVGIAAGVANLYVSANKVASEAGILGSFVATGTLSYVRLLTIGTSGYVDFDNVSVRLAVPDLSTADNGLGVYGSITKAAVATGADLVGYSGFSASNYLEQPYNADLDFGTGDFCFIGWANIADIGATTDYILERYDGATTATRLNCVCLSGKLYMRCGNETITGSTDIDTGEPVFLAILRRSGNLYLYVDAVSDAAAVASTSSMTLAEPLRFGTSASGVSSWGGSLSLWRAFDYALTAAQIKAIYDKEKVLFEEYAYYTQEGEEYTLDIAPQQYDPSGNHVRNRSTSLSGVQEILYLRKDSFWDVTTGYILDTELDPVRRFVDSVAEGQTFTLAPPDPLTETHQVTLDSDNYAENRVDSSHYFAVSFRCKEAP